MTKPPNMVIKVTTEIHLQKRSLGGEETTTGWPSFSYIKDSPEKPSDVSTGAENEMKSKAWLYWFFCHMTDHSQILTPILGSVSQEL